MKVKKSKLAITVLLAITITGCAHENIHTHVDGVSYLHKELSDERETLYATLTETGVGKPIPQKVNSSAIAEEIGEEIQETIVKQSGKFVLPVAIGKYNSAWGFRSDKIFGPQGDWHSGIDISKPANYEKTSYEGEPVYASAMGVVLGIVNNNTTKGMGNKVVIAHDMEGTGLGQTSTVYGHLKDVKVKVGDKVNTNSIIGTVGNTGASFGAHLHFEIRLNREKFFPEYAHFYLEKYANITGNQGYLSKGEWSQGWLAINPLTFLEGYSEDFPMNSVMTRQ